MLFSKMLKLSTVHYWDDIVLEWNVDDIYEDDEFCTCACGHYPIKEVCVLKNIKNGNVINVGNCCVKKFIGMDSSSLFNSIKRIKKDVNRSVSKEALTFYLNKFVINNIEYKFYNDIIRKRKLSDKQRAWKTKINNKIISNERLVKDNII